MLSKSPQNPWQIKPANLLIYPPISVLQLLTSFGKPQLSTLQLLQDQYPLYSPIKEDGNSFYRAIAYSYIISKEDWSFDYLFRQLNDLDLQYVSINSIPVQFLDFYNNNMLKELFRKGWETFVEDQVDNLNAPEKLINVLNQRALLDFILVLYFRSLSHYKRNFSLRNTSAISNLDQNQNSSRMYNQIPKKEHIIQLAKALQHEIYIVTVDESNNIKSEIIQGNSININSRIPILKYQGSYNSLYTFNQAKIINLFTQRRQDKQEKPSKQKSYLSPKRSYENEEQITYWKDENEKSSSQFAQNDNMKTKLPFFGNKGGEEVINRDSRQPERESINKSNHLHIQFSFDEPDNQNQLVNHSRMHQQRNFSDLASRTHSLQNSNDNYEGPSEDKSWNLKRTMRLVLLVCIILSISYLIYKSRYPSVAQFDNSLKPAREVHFVKDLQGNYKAIY